MDLTDSNKRSSLPIKYDRQNFNSAVLDKLKLTGRNLGRVFKSRLGRVCTDQELYTFYRTAWLKVENSAQTTFRLSPVSTPVQSTEVFVWFFVNLIYYFFNLLRFGEWPSSIPGVSDAGGDWHWISTVQRIRSDPSWRSEAAGLRIVSLGENFFQPRLLDRRSAWKER
jgi:hypothetical protein